jgi:hypothetical protein
MPNRRVRNRISYPFPSLTTDRPDLIKYKEAVEDVLQYTLRDRKFLSSDDARKFKEIEEIAVWNLEKLINIQNSIDK